MQPLLGLLFFYNTFFVYRNFGFLSIYRFLVYHYRGLGYFFLRGASTSQKTNRAKSASGKVYASSNGGEHVDFMLLHVWKRKHPGDRRRGSNGP